MATTSTKKKGAAKPAAKPKAAKAKPAAKIAAKPATKAAAKPAKPTKEQLQKQREKELLERRRADAAELRAGERVEIDLEHIITDCPTLRVLATEAMGEFAAEALGDEQAIEDYTKNGSTYVNMVHPLDLHISDINPREFATTEMIQRVAEMTQSVAAHGVKEPLTAYVESGRLLIKSGETRWRATLHAWILHSKGMLATPPTRLKVLMEASGTNNTERMLDVIIHNASKSLNPIEAAKNMKRAIELGMSEDDVAARLGKNKQYVTSHVLMLGMPQLVLNEVRSGALAATLAWKWWQESGENERALLARVFDAKDYATRTTAEGEPVRVMPKHDRARSGGGPRENTRSVSAGRAPKKPEQVDQTQLNRFDVIGGIWQAVEHKGLGDGFVRVDVPVDDWFRINEIFKADIPESVQRMAGNKAA